MKVHKKAFNFYNKGFEKTNIQCSCVSLPLQFCSMRDYWIAKTIIDGVEVAHTHTKLLSTLLLSLIIVMLNA